MTLSITKRQIRKRTTRVISYIRLTWLCGKNEQGPEDSGRILRTIELALRKQSGVHVIFLDKSFTGDIVKYDRERLQLIIKNFKKSMTTIIRVQDIKRISLVPNNIREAQKKDIRITNRRFKR